MTNSDEFERLRNAEKNYGTGAVVATALGNLTSMLGEIEKSLRGINNNINGILKLMENVDDKNIP